MIRNCISIFSRDHPRRDDKKLYILVVKYFFREINIDAKVSTRSVRTIYKKPTKSSLPKYHKQRCDVLGLAFIQFYL